MAYARFGPGSDVYVLGTRLGHTGGGVPILGFECCRCRFVETEFVDDPGSTFGGFTRARDGGPTSYTTQSRSQMVAHLKRHREAGHGVPQTAIGRLAGDNEWGAP